MFIWKSTLYLNSNGLLTISLFQSIYFNSRAMTLNAVVISEWPLNVKGSVRGYFQIRINELDLDLFDKRVLFHIDLQSAYRTRWTKIIPLDALL